MTSSHDTIDHRTLGCSLRGKSSSTSVQFRNLKYASVPARYKESVPANVLKTGADGVVDATQFGPSCPHGRGGQAFDVSLVGNVVLPCEKGQGNTEKMDEFECLQLNVTVPKSVLYEGRKSLPVFAWVHGGGLSIGSNNWPQYDLQRFVERSEEIGKPVIGVAINYRVGLLGFVASEELGAPGNMGFKDQIHAFRWIKKHIAGFGGEPNNVTAAGESAGAISLSTLLCAEINEGLFERVVIMSGETNLRKPRNTWWQAQMYKDQAGIIASCKGDRSKLKETLLQPDAEALSQQIPLAQHYCAHIDGKWMTTNPTLSVLTNGRRPEHKPSWCKEFVIGDTAHDGTVLKSRVLDDHLYVIDRLHEACRKNLSSAETGRLLAAYKLDQILSSIDEYDALRYLISELRFYIPALAAHKGWKATSPPKKAGRYHFHVLNPFDGEFKGISSHELDVAFLLQNFNDHLDDRDRILAQGVADQFIGFANGEGWASEGKIVAFGPNGVIEVGEEEYDREYRDGRGGVLESIEAEKLWRVAEMWQGVRSEDDESISPKL